MPVIQLENIAGIESSDGVICSEHMTQDEWSSLNTGQVITTDDLDNADRIFLCDRCGEQL